MNISTVLFVIQVIIMICLVLYIYYIFRHNVKIPTAEECIAQISPGLADLTKTQDRIVFWFYSLGEKKFKKYTLDSDMKTFFEHNASAYDVVNNLKNNFYYNFGRQRWEKKVPHVDTPQPYVNKNLNSIEQKFTLCYIDEDAAADGKVDLICNELRQQTFLKLKINHEMYKFNEETLQLELDTKSVFPVDSNICTFTMNRYREYLGINYDYSNASDNREILIGVYFVREQNANWTLEECPSPDSMYFDGTVCRTLPLTDNAFGDIQSVNLAENIHPRRRHNIVFSALHSTHRHTRRPEHFKNQMTNTTLTHKPHHNNIQSCHLQLNNIYSVFINLNAGEKMYPLNVKFYAACQKTLFIVGTTTQANATEMTYTWKLQQIINRTTVLEMKKLKLKWCPFLYDPYKVYNVRTSQSLTQTTPFLIYNNRIYFLRKYLLKLYALIAKTTYTIVDSSSSNDTDNNHTVQEQYLLPHVRQYQVTNRNSRVCNLFATFAGNTIFDVCIETRLLVEYVEKVQKYAFFRRNMYPTIPDDFQATILACAQNVKRPEMFTYISIVDMFGLEAHVATTNPPSA